MDARDLKSLIESLGGEIIRLEQPVKTVKQAAKAVKTPYNRIIKSLVFITEKLGPVLVIVDGSSKVNLNKISSKFGKARLADPVEVRKYTGYNIGGVPPVGIPLQTLIDRLVLHNDYVYGGGGDEYKLCRIDPRKIKEYQNAEVLDISTK